MPLIDHFHHTLPPRPGWSSFAALWANAIVDHLNRALPRRYFAENRYKLAHYIEQDVTDERGPAESDDPPAGTVLAYEPPEPALVLPALFADHVGVVVRDESDGAAVVAVVELALEGNKEGPEARRAFAARCVAHLQGGAGLVVVDAVTASPANLHDELVRLLDLGAPFWMPAGTSLAAVAYRPARRGGVNEIDAWPVALAVGAALPVLPLALPGGRAMPLDLEATYTDARQRAWQYRPASGVMPSV